MKILVVGSGGREHTLVWKLARDPEVEKVYCAPGNPGMKDAELIDIKADAIDELKDYVKAIDIDLTVIAPGFDGTRGISLVKALWHTAVCDNRAEPIVCDE